MVAAAPARPMAALPRPLVWLGVPLLALALIATFMVMRFPYPLLRDFLVEEVRGATGVDLAIQELGPSFGLGGPAVRATNVRATWLSGESVELDHLKLRPAWSLAWLRGNPAIHADFAGPLGAASGTLTMGDAPGWDGDLEQVDAGRLPLATFFDGASLEGRVDADVDLAVPAGAAPEGSVTFEASEGSLALPGFPMALPYEQLRGDLVFGGETYLQVNSLELQGPLISGTATGTVGNARRFDSAPIRIEAELSAQPAMRAALQGAGIRIGRDGKAQVSISGTPANPVMR